MVKCEQAFIKKELQMVSTIKQRPRRQQQIIKKEIIESEPEEDSDADSKVMSKIKRKEKQRDYEKNRQSRIKTATIRCLELDSQLKEMTLDRDFALHQINILRQNLKAAESKITALQLMLPLVEFEGELRE
ncbi:unnamed protein product [Symbiodinium sp. CCMP2592]|nr:unnamed protein product [Symbiodinium sp. CCMP2592]CAE7274146.1 unnamed protein product [Symbiodinium sp. CCMP2592]CAE7289570.1 unnamed protein product [Symbiodinium sp. CCMP2592]CAE7331352.1 unnamed protein product [Symbiodinium sp. CCMP2592]CAE7342355.1 unnamed protein product [Symbiodinium sp. CCMP2592]